MIIDSVTHQHRQTGASTRLIDYYIQQLFTTGKAVIQDHYPNPIADQILFDRFVARLVSEHKQNNFKINKSKLTITLL